MLDVSSQEKSPYILVVDDDDDDVFLIRNALKRIGWGAGAKIQCGRVDNGVDAVSLLSRKDAGVDLPAAVILDINMPKLDGIGVLRALRHAPGLRELPIFVLTTTANETAHVTAMDLGATRIFVKPNTMTELTRIVREILDAVDALASTHAAPRAPGASSRSPGASPRSPEASQIANF
ncbi:CheY-like chemotaxis protein [Rhodoblastus sphagnicola]|nr:response regulator [Rhodoblastus sphagnicola]MBB4198578.1 CheY-like chemotaxis protein [Rhodoblastus sphagnicola]